MLAYHTLDAIQTLLQNLNLRAVRETDKMVAGAVKQVATARGVQVEENAGDDNDLFLKARLEEAEAIGNGLGKALKVQPASYRMG